MKINNNTKIIILIIIILIAISSFIIIKYASFGEYKPDFMLEEEYIEPKKCSLKLKGVQNIEPLDKSYSK